nr:glycoside hydrolase family 43 protein [Microbacterium bovistercoris]
MRRLAVAALLGALVLTGCAPTAAPAATSTSGPFVIDADFPDPDVVADADGYLAFATGTFGVNIQVASSPDLRTWTVERRDALPKLPTWASSGRTWAPDVSETDGRAVMYFAAEHTDSGRQCIGVATADTLEGPFAPASGDPLICPLEAGGAIDPSTFVDGDGTRYLLWKTDGNCCGLDTWIEIAPLRADGLGLAGPPHRLIRQTEAWEGQLVEAPTLIRHGDRYVLFYSANDYASDAYAVGAATSTSLLGPYVKQATPVITSSGPRRGPGGQDVVTGERGDVLVFHSWDEQHLYRGMMTAPLTWSADGVHAAAP